MIVLSAGCSSLAQLMRSDIGASRLTAEAVAKARREAADRQDAARSSPVRQMR